MQSNETTYFIINVIFLFTTYLNVFHRFNVEFLK